MRMLYLRKEQLKAQIEAKKKKKAKYNEKIRETEQLREKEAGKWKSFQHKVCIVHIQELSRSSLTCPFSVLFQAGKKSFTGVIKKSIFATSESTGGRVGVGTCGISGKPMTKDAPLAAGKAPVVKKATLYNPKMF